MSSGQFIPEVKPEYKTFLSETNILLKQVPGPLELTLSNLPSLIGVSEEKGSIVSGFAEYRSKRL